MEEFVLSKVEKLQKKMELLCQKGIARGCHLTTLARHLRDTRASHVMTSTTTLIKEGVGRLLLGLPML